MAFFLALLIIHWKYRKVIDFNACMRLALWHTPAQNSPDWDPQKCTYSTQGCVNRLLAVFVYAWKSAKVPLEGAIHISLLTILISLSSLKIRLLYKESNHVFRVYREYNIFLSLFTKSVHIYFICVWLFSYSSFFFLQISNTRLFGGKITSKFLEWL